MRSLILSEESYQALMAVFSRYCASGIDPQELTALATLYPQLLVARSFEASQVTGANLSTSGPGNVTLATDVAGAEDNSSPKPSAS